jgi:hypothetical protein
MIINHIDDALEINLLSLEKRRGALKANIALWRQEYREAINAYINSRKTILCRSFVMEEVGLMLRQLDDDAAMIDALCRQIKKLRDALHMAGISPADVLGEEREG